MGSCSHERLTHGVAKPSIGRPRGSRSSWRDVNLSDPRAMVPRETSPVPREAVGWRLARSDPRRLLGFTWNRGGPSGTHRAPPRQEVHPLSASVQRSSTGRPPPRGHEPGRPHPTFPPNVPTLVTESVAPAFKQCVSEPTARGRPSPRSGPKVGRPRVSSGRHPQTGHRGPPRRTLVDNAAARHVPRGT